MSCTIFPWAQHNGLQLSTPFLPLGSQFMFLLIKILFATMKGLYP